MKKYYSFAAMCTVALVAALSLTSCDKNDDNNVTPSDWKNGEVLIKTDFSQDLLSMFDVTINVTDFNGNTTSLTPEVGSKSYSYITTSKNGVAKVSYKATMKPGIKADGQTYDFTCGCKIIYRINASDGGYIQLDAVNPTCGTITGSGTKFIDDKIIELTKKAFEKAGDYTFTLKDGSFIQINS